MENAKSQANSQEPPRKPGTFSKGSGAAKDPRIAKGGKRPGAGRKPDWFKRQAERLVEKYKILPRMAQIAAGKAVAVEQQIAVDGKKRKDGKPAARVLKIVTVRESAKFETQGAYTDRLLDRAFGKARQEVEVKGGLTEIDIVALIQRAEEERGLKGGTD